MSYNQKLKTISAPAAGMVDRPYLPAGEKLSIHLKAVHSGKLRLLAVPLLIFNDILAFYLSILIAFVIRALLLPVLIKSFPPISLFVVLEIIWWVPLLGCILFIYEKSYIKRLPFWQEAGQIVKTTTLAFLVAICIVFLAKLGDATSRTLVLLSWAVSLFIVPTLRYLGKLVLVKLHIWEKPVIIVGAGETGKLIANALHREPTIGYKPVGFLDDDKVKQLHPPELASGQEVPVLGSFDAAEAIMEQSGIRDIIVAAPGMESKKLVQLVNRLQRKAHNLLVVPDLFGMAMEGVDVQYLFNERTLVLGIKNNLNDKMNLAVKRLFDLLLSIILLPLLSPIMLLIGIAIKLDSKGPILFKDKRIGKNGEEFNCYKFRSMYLNADEILNQYLALHPRAKKEWDKYAKLKDYDPRVTKVGSIIRKLSLDELPQIFNVLKGEMSLVGPRPYLPRERERMEGREDILLTRPGITGLWQVSGRNDIEFNDRLRMDTWYVRNWSLWLDISLLFRTVGVVLGRKGAY
ncbi:undecaprenyl-phosphate galactose phosphotransferase WbaP [Desulfallas sp. Bu1-1]|uniref:undecaprenyl-phosphate galactose phosphotransferase WbaP n=1 Tax=Desulfallas sp. Bu1-1 TaxID=2787620 RepID=UPI00189F95D8|nr:undecaprenyl-phosphate galactose phosphotransferase WbaP [Desulfallas sp. Bu1-1]MBF7081583.1 undecaprenyl-phosphate galactose phosphotransferase WbaP [Desulfallas sp. Bu1-1]